jgi:poly(ADP-ribose) glycohydrolase ARH3
LTFLPSRRRSGTFVGSARYRQQLDMLREILPGGSLEEVIIRLGHGVAAHEAVPTALYAFLHYHDAAAAVATFSIGLGGDTDTIASMAGALAVAHLGEQVFPASWRARVEDGARLRELASHLLVLALSRAPAGPQPCLRTLSQETSGPFMQSSRRRLDPQETHHEQ